MDAGPDSRPDRPPDRRPERAGTPDAPTAPAAETDALRDAAILVTGATGFIGGHLAARLATEHGARVTGTGRDLSKGRFLEEAGVALVRADLLEPGDTARVVDGKDVVFHVAAWMGGGDGSRAEAINVEATARLARSAAEAGVARFVHLSSIAAYGVPDRPRIEEDHSLATEIGEAYARTKARGEERARRVAREAALGLTVVRPAYVYGPRSRGWTVNLVRRVCGGRPAMIGDGGAPFHQIYIDNLVDLLLVCAASPAAAGEAFNASEKPTTWRDFLGRYGAMCGREPRSLPLWMARAMAWVGELPGVPVPLDRTRLGMATARTEFSNRKARSRLGWSPRVDLEEGMRRTEAWLRAEGHL